MAETMVASTAAMMAGRLVDGWADSWVATTAVKKAATLAIGMDDMLAGLMAD